MFKLKDRVKRIGELEVFTVENIHEPDEHVLDLNPAAETMSLIQPGEDVASRLFVKESELAE